MLDPKPLSPVTKQGEKGESRPELTEEQREQRMAHLQALGDSLAKTRKEAIDGRKASGIEDVWREDEEQYEGVDDKNRAFVAGNSGQTKPPWQGGAAVMGEESIEYPNITGPYVDTAAALVGDILLPNDERAWSIKETPIPELVEKASGALPLEVIEGLAEIDATEELAIQVAQAEAQAAEAMIEEAKEKAERAQKRIEDWQVECQWHAEMREVIDDAAKVGTGILKGPIPERKKVQMFRDGTLIIEEAVKPVSKRVDYWNCFPDPGCGRTIHKGRYHWERDYITAIQLEGLKKDPDYIASQIDACLEEGPAKRSEVRQTADGRYLDDEKLFEIWYFYGYATREDLAAAGCECPEDGPHHVPVLFTMVNDRVVKGATNHLDTGEFPYDYLPWQRRKNSPWGLGVARKIRTPQRMLVASVRVMLTNAGRAAGPILVLRNGVKGADGKNDMRPWKVYYAAGSDAGNDASKAAQLIEIPALTDKLMLIVNLALKMAEDTTGLPMMLQGQQGTQAPDTLGGQLLADRRASGTLRRLARVTDDCITEPHTRRYYAYLLLYGPEDIEKGEFVIDARGSTNFVERYINQQQAMAYLEASLNPAFGLDPKKAMAEKLRADNMNPKNLQVDEEDAQAQAQQGPPPDPRAEASKEVANIRAKADVDKATITATSDMEELRFKAAEAARQRAHERQLAQLTHQTKLVEFAERRGISLGEVKAQLAETVMKLRTQTKLSVVRGKGPQVASPAIEPAGRAPEGQAFQK